MQLSVVIVTHNRCAALRATLEALAGNVHLPHGSMEVLIVDNGSTDGSPDAATCPKLAITVIRRDRNEGVSARNHAFAIARGRYVLLIDDDSYPMSDAVMRSMQYLDGNRQCAAVVGRVELPDGRLEASALPGVVANGAVVLRKSVIDEVGGFPTEFFRQAEEYDLSFRIWNAGWRIERFEDLLYRHEKVGGNRSAAIIHRMDMRNNLILVDRYLPAAWRSAYRADWTQRYHALARHAKMSAAAWRGRIGAWPWRFRAMLGDRLTLADAAFESIFGLATQRERVTAWVKEHAIRCVVIADFSKNIRATYSACVAADLDVLAVADQNNAFTGLEWMSLPIRSDRRALAGQPDGIVLSNINPAQVAVRQAALQQVFTGPILTLWEPQLLGARGSADRPNYHDAA